MELILEKQAEQKHEETPLEAFASICGVLVVGLFVLTFVFQNFAIPSSSRANYPGRRASARWMQNNFVAPPFAAPSLA